LLHYLPKLRSSNLW